MELKSSIYVIKTKFLEDTMVEVVRFLEDSGLSIAPEKCQLCTFSKDTRITPKFWCMMIDGQRVKLQSTVKFLDLHFESSLSWIKQIEIVREKCVKPVAIISYLSYLRV